MYRDEWRAIINTQCSSLVRVFELNCSCRQHRVSSYNNLTRVTSCCDMWAWRHHFNWQAYNSNTCFHTIIDCEFTTTSCFVSCGLWDFARQGSSWTVSWWHYLCLHSDSATFAVQQVQLHSWSHNTTARCLFFGEDNTCLFFWNTYVIVHLLNHASHTHM